MFEDVRNDMIIAQEAIFGPVLALIKIETIEEALEVANDVEFGLSASIYTKDIGFLYVCKYIWRGVSIPHIFLLYHVHLQYSKYISLGVSISSFYFRG